MTKFSQNFHLLKRPLLTKKSRWFFVRASVTFVTLFLVFFSRLPLISCYELDRWRLSAPDKLVLDRRTLYPSSSRVWWTTWEAQAPAPHRLQARQDQRHPQEEGLRRAARPCPQHNQPRHAETTSQGECLFSCIILFISSYFFSRLRRRGWTRRVTEGRLTLTSGRWWNSPTSGKRRTRPAPKLGIFPPHQNSQKVF